MGISNATNLIEAKDRLWPGSAEHFWTAIFAIFALHLGANPRRSHDLTIWRATDGAGGKYYAPREKRPRLSLDALTFDSLTVEPPQGLSSRPWPGTKLTVPPDAGGFSPDIVIRSAIDPGVDHFVIIENKVSTGARLVENQMENYQRLGLGWRHTPYRSTSYFSNRSVAKNFTLKLACCKGCHGASTSVFFCGRRFYV